LVEAQALVEEVRCQAALLTAGAARLGVPAILLVILMPTVMIITVVLLRVIGLGVVTMVPCRVASTVVVWRCCCCRWRSR
jgi:hypothetical protein